MEKQRASLRAEKSELEDKEYNLSNRLRQTEVRFQAMNTQLDEAMRENATLQTKLNTHNSSFVSASGNAAQESMEKMRADHELEEHKWNAEKFKLQARIQELEQTVKAKD